MERHLERPEDRRDAPAEAVGRFEQTLLGGLRAGRLNEVRRGLGDPEPSERRTGEGELLFFHLADRGHGAVIRRPVDEKEGYTLLQRDMVVFASRMDWVAQGYELEFPDGHREEIENQHELDGETEPLGLIPPVSPRFLRIDSIDDIRPVSDGELRDLQSAVERIMKSTPAK